MNVVITVPWGERLGGAENMLWTFLRHVDDVGIEPVVVFLAPGPFQEEVAALGVRTLDLRSGRLRQAIRGARAIRALAAFLRREQPDLILNWAQKTHLYGAAAAVIARMTDRVVWWQHGVPDGHWLDRLSTLLPTRAVGCSSYASARAQERIRPRRETFVVHPGIDVEPGNRTDPVALRRRLSIPDGAVVVGIVGRLQPWKCQDKFVRAIADLRRRGHEVHGLVVGGNAYDLSPGYEEDLRSLSRRLALDAHLVFTGQVPDARPYITAMDVLVNASAPEPFGLVLLEGMALGVPVVAVDAGGPAEIVEHGRSGVLVPDNAAETIADAIERLVVDPGLRLRIGERGKQRQADLFTGKHMVEELERNLRASAVRRRRRARSRVGKACESGSNTSHCGRDYSGERPCHGLKEGDPQDDDD